MNLLALETSTLMGSLALVADGRLVSEYQTLLRQTYSEMLIPLIDHVLRTAGVSIEEIDTFAVAQGPGSFTALRIGMSVIMGLALATRKQIVSVPSLDGLAYNVNSSSHVICPLLDARRGEVYGALYRAAGDAHLERLTPYTVTRPDKLIRGISGQVVFLGDGAALYKDLLRQELKENALFAPLHLSHPRASSIAVLALQRLSAPGSAGSEHIAPLYVRPFDAETKC